MSNLIFSTKNIFLIVAFALVLALATGCGNIRTVISGGALTIENAAEIVARECGNTAPDGPCLPTSRITTVEKNDFKIRLQTAQDLLNDANDLNRVGDISQAEDKIAEADKILAALERILIQRSIEQ